MTASTASRPRSGPTIYGSGWRWRIGLVQINQNLVVQANLSYGGVKSSGLGKEASLEAMLEHFMHKKTIMVNYG